MRYMTYCPYCNGAVEDTSGCPLCAGTNVVSEWSVKDAVEDFEESALAEGTAAE